MELIVRLIHMCGDGYNTNCIQQCIAAEEPNL